MSWLRGDDIIRHPVPLLTNAFERIPWVFRCANALAEQIANIPFLFSRGERGRETLITSGPLIDFYNHPHPRLNRFQYWEQRVLWLLLRGECFRVPIFDDSLSAPGGEGRGEVVPSRTTNPSSVALWGKEDHASPDTQHERRNTKDARSTLLRSNTRTLKSVVFLDPADCHPIIQNHELVGWRYTGRNTSPVPSQVFLPEEVWFDRLSNPFDNWRGLSPLTPANTAIYTDHAASNFMRNFVENNAEGGLIIRTENNLTDEQRVQISASIRNRRAAGNSTPILLWGATEVIQPTLSSADIQFLENRKFSRAEICAAFGVPEEIVSTSDHNKYDVMQGARLNFIENRVAPFCARLEAEEQRVVTTIDPNAVGWFDLESLPIMEQARRDRLATAKIGFDMGIPLNELNRVLDLGFQSLPWGNTGYASGSLAPLGQLPPDRRKQLPENSIPFHRL
jgi:HK97 family phage portal protein